MHATQTLQRKCACGGACGSCNQESQLRRSAIVSKRGESNLPGAFEDPLHQPMLDRMREEGGLDPEGFPDAYLKYGCPPGRGASRSTVTIQPVQIARDDGTSPTAAPPFGVATSIWNNCCVSLTVNATQTINRTDFQTLTDTGPGTPPTQEENDLWAAIGGGTQVNVVSIRNFDVGGTITTTNRGGGTTFGRGRVDPMILLVDGAIGEVVAHEIGHAMGFAGHAGGAGTIMQPSGSPTTANPVHVNAEVCRRARTAPVHTIGTTRCCQSFT
jgi:hypothetical protein